MKKEMYISLKTIAIVKKAAVIFGVLMMPVFFMALDFIPL
jgi:hypothetical protein